MTLTQLVPPYPIFTDRDGSPLDAGYLYFGEPNLNPETNPIQVYYDPGLTQPLAQPIRTSNGYVMRNGSPALIYADGQFSVTVRNKKNELVIYSPAGFGVTPGVPFSVFQNSAKNVTDLLAGIQFTYSAGIPNTIQVVVGDILRTEAEGFAYEVAASGATDQNVITAGGVKLYVLPDAEGGRSVLAFGAKGDGVTDDSVAIQAALSVRGLVIFPLGESYTRFYNHSQPLYVDEFTTIRGPNQSDGNNPLYGVVLQKTTAAVGTGSNTAPIGGGTTSYAVNASIIVRHRNGAWAYKLRIEGISISSLARGGAANAVEYGIFAPFVSNSSFDRVSFWQHKVGIYHENAWMMNCDEVRMFLNTVSADAAAAGVGTAGGWPSGSTGWKFVYPGTSASTSYNWKGCWVRDAHIGYDLVGLAYSAMMGCGADNISERPYFFTTVDISLNGCGSENSYISSGKAVFSFSGSRAVLNNCTGEFHKAGASGSPFYIDLNSNSRVVANACNFKNWQTVGAGYNLRIDSGSHLESSEAYFPTNGNSFIGYGGGATWVRTYDGITEWRNSIGVRSSSNFLLPSGGSPNQLIISSKAISGAGSNVFTITLSGGTSSTKAFAFFDIDVKWWDGSFANGLGFSKLTLLCYREGASDYYQDVKVYQEARAGNSLTGYPAFTLTRVGDVWTLVMTPANGDCTSDFGVSNSQRVQNGGTFSVAVA